MKNFKIDPGKINSVHSYSPAGSEKPMFKDRIIRPKELSQITGLSLTTIWRLDRDEPSFPKKIRLSKGCTGYHLSTVYEWLEKKKGCA